MHNRKELVENKFFYRYFMFYLNLDEIDNLAEELNLFNRNKFNVFNFRDRDHLDLGKTNTKENILEYLRQNNVNDAEKIMLLTNVATFGYNFNPVSFYFCFDKEDKPVCVIPEVGNTFNELKPFFIGGEKLHGDTFKARMEKHFYVSPFIPHDIFFDFNLTVPNENLKIKIDDYKENDRVFITHLNGKRKELTNYNLVKYMVKYPFVTLKVIFAIHWQALKLIIKKVPYFKKEEFPELQKGVYVKWKKQ